jgi:hypothetical protein
MEAGLCFLCKQPVYFDRDDFWKGVMQKPVHVVHYYHDSCLTASREAVQQQKNPNQQSLPI